MPTSYRPNLDHKAFDLVRGLKDIASGLAPHRDEILELVGFAEEYRGFDDIAGEDPDSLLDEIVGALAKAAAVAVDETPTPTNQLVANIKAIISNPAHVHEKRGQLDPTTVSAIARLYQRSDERPGTHWGDISGDSGVSPSAANVRAAAARALEATRLEARRGAPHKPEIEVLARELGAIFRGFHYDKIKRLLQKDRPDDAHWLHSDTGQYRRFLEVTLAVFSDVVKEYRRAYSANIQTVIDKTLDLQ